MAEVESKIKKDLLSNDVLAVKNGLSNVLYWGYARMGIRNTRVARFRQKVSTQQLSETIHLFSHTLSPSLIQIKKIELPEFSGVSFVSKIRMFLDPTNSATLDFQIMKITQECPDTILANVHVSEKSTQINITENNSLTYEAWCKKNRDISTRYYSSQYRAVDVERGFFQLIQCNQVKIAGEILRDA
ncbi:MAG: hypothetical protein EPN94_01845 [Nitrospirae bacterium]|nr:MAG: hypothetical protein EPN94_01845 [Nitrospirota bacterium]